VFIAGANLDQDRPSGEKGSGEMGSGGTEGGLLRTSGGRVLAVSAQGDTPEAARARAYQAMETVQFTGMGYRRDIGAS